MNNNIGEFIKYMRKLRKITQKQLGEKLGIDSRAISKWESGVYLPDITMLTRISDELGITVVELLRCQLNEPKVESLIDESIPENNVEDSKIEDDIKSSKKKIIFKKTHRIIIVSILVFLTIISITSLSIKVANGKKKDISDSDNVTVYQISSDDENLIIEGYIIQNNKSYLTIINKIIVNKDKINVLKFNKEDSVTINLCEEEKCLVTYDLNDSFKTNLENDYYEISNISSQMFSTRIIDLNKLRLNININNDEIEKNIAQYSLKIYPYFS